MTAEETTETRVGPAIAFANVLAKAESSWFDLRPPKHQGSMADLADSENSKGPQACCILVREGEAWVSDGTTCPAAALTVLWGQMTILNPETQKGQKTGLAVSLMTYFSSSPTLNIHPDLKGRCCL